LNSIIRTRTNCPTRSISVSARSKRLWCANRRGSVVYDPAEIARAGVFVSIDSKGRLSVDLGYFRPEDKAPVPDPETEQGADTSSTGVEEVTALVHGAVISVAGAPVETEDDDEDVTTPSPDRLITELSTSHAGFAGCAGRKPRHQKQCCCTTSCWRPFTGSLPRGVARRSDFSHLPFPPKLPV